MVEAKEIGVTVHASTGMTTAWHVAFTLEGDQSKSPLPCEVVFWVLFCPAGAACPRLRG